MDLSGAATSASITTTFVGSGSFGASDTDLKRLMGDYLLGGPSWKITISGLVNGYDFYYYAPWNANFDTGTFTVNGTSAPNLQSSAGGAAVQGIDWQKLSGIAVTDGTLTTTWGGSASFFGSGLSGVQIVAAPVPEPSTWVAGAILALGFGLQSVRSLRKRNQAELLRQFTSEARGARRLILATAADDDADRLRALAC